MGNTRCRWYPGWPELEWVSILNLTTPDELAIYRLPSSVSPLKALAVATKAVGDAAKHWLDQTVSFRFVPLLELSSRHEEYSGIICADPQAITS